MISKILRIALCTSSFSYTFYVLVNLTIFLSKETEHSQDIDPLQDEGLILKTLWIILMNTSLLCAFILQHSVMASDLVKNIYYKFNIEDIERSVYNASSAAILHILICEWQPVPWAALWNFNTLENNKLWFVVSAFHIVGWAIVYSGCVMMDIAELSGLKQVYYKLSGRPRPMAMKSRELQRYYMHMRHPSFTGFLIILWVYPLMSLDRLLLASLLTSYMILMWSIDQEDYNYHYKVIAKKERELSIKKY